MRWDSDHVVLFDDETREIASEIVRCGGLDGRVKIALDFFDASINRIAAWVVGFRNVQKALLWALLLPDMRALQDAGRWTEIIRQYTEITKLDESILFALVDRIEVGEAQKVKGVRVRDVKVYYRYVGNVDDAVAEERREQYEQAV